MLARRLTHPEDSQETIARDLEVSEASVSRLLRRYGPVSHALKGINRDLFTSAFQFAAIESLDTMYADKADGKLTAGDRRNYAVSSAVFAEKALLFAGQPTQIVAGMHEVRVEMPALLAKLAEVGSRIKALGPAQGEA